MSSPRRVGARVPPQNLEAEESLLGAMLLSRDAIAAALGARVTTADFYKPAHGHIFEAIMGLYVQGEPVDPVSVAEQLRRVEMLDALGGRATLLRIEAGTPASANATHYATIVSELALLRRLIGVGGDIAEMGYDEPEDLREMLDRAEGLLFGVTEGERTTSPSSPIAEVVQRTLDRVESRKPGLLGVPTGYRDVDDLLLGLQASQLIVVAARPSMGKSSWALGAAVNVARAANRPVVFFSMEMTELDLGMRLIAGEARVGLRQLQQWTDTRPTLTESDWTKITHAVARVAPAPLEVDDNPHCTIMDIRSKARRVKASRGDLGLIVVDYLQLMTPLRTGSRTSENRQVEVAEISRGLKVLARELDCPVLALAQLNRQLEYRTDKRPMLADLRDSGALEQDADVVVFLYRDEVYNPESDQRGTAEVIVAKHRNGPTGVTRLAFLDDFTKFADRSRYHDQEQLSA